MATQPVPSSSDPRHLLATTGALVQRVRREQRGAWFPLLVFAAVRFAAAPIVEYGQGPCDAANGGLGGLCVNSLPPAMWYWPVALLLAYVAISWFYLRRSAKLGLGTRIQPYLVLGVALALLMAADQAWTAAHPGFLAELDGTGPISVFARTVLSPAGTIGLALLLLARIERSWPLLAVTCGYLLAMLSSDSRPDPSPWSFLPSLLLEGGVLLVGGVVLALLHRAQGRSAG
ncbi:hypothetical protein ABH930_003653 [Kitasatospora sp. GAS204A]|uniref:hypothetical protein n=1 Tax=unclassified Kitasatospora TaxID=2633591 RepID=UPI002473929E|nr:hypothetical protein [Kitasatospora sp. GAS204B]MDH6118708.1 hypothetical protein [Kitasatospora sp. GAS204B]